MANTGGMRGAEKAQSRSVPPPRTIHRAARERAIVAAAKKAFIAKGYDAASVAEIAKEVGVVEGTVYTYFDSKLSLLYRVILEFYEPLIADVERSMQRVSGIRNRIRFVIWRQLVAFIEEPEICYLVIRQLHSSARSYDTFVVDLARRYTAVSVRLVNDGIESGEFRPGISPLLIRSVIYGSIENLYWRLLYRDQEIDAERMADEIADVVFSGIAAENAHKQSVQPSDSALLQALLSEALQEIRRLNENLEKLRQESSDI